MGLRDGDWVLKLRVSFVPGPWGRSAFLEAQDARQDEVDRDHIVQQRGKNKHADACDDRDDRGEMTRHDTSRVVLRVLRKESVRM